MKNNGLLILEITWIVIAIVSAVAGIMYSISPGGSRTYVFFGMAAVATLFAWARHHQRKKSQL
jgi:hypothetical protein